MPISLPYPVGQHIKIYMCEDYPAISEDQTVGGGIGQELAAGEIITALKKTSLDPIENTSTTQYIKVYLKNTSDSPVYTIKAYLQPSLGAWSVAAENSTGVTDTTYSGGEFPTNILRPEGFVFATRLEDAISVIDSLLPNETIALWIKAEITYNDLVTHPGVSPSCGLVVVYAVST